jgi:hypothetical protein
MMRVRTADRCNTRPPSEFPAATLSVSQMRSFSGYSDAAVSRPQQHRRNASRQLTLTRHVRSHLDRGPGVGTESSPPFAGASLLRPAPPSTQGLETLDTTSPASTRSALPVVTQRLGALHAMSIGVANVAGGEFGGGHVGHRNRREVHPVVCGLRPCGSGREPEDSDAPKERWSESHAAIVREVSVYRDTARLQSNQLCDEFAR